MRLFEWLFSEKASIDVGFSVAVLIDMQKAFVDKVENERRNTLIEAQISVIRYCVAKDVPLIVLEYLGQGTTIEELRSEYIDRVPRVTVITRDEYDGFYRTELERILDSLRADSLLFMGISASCCVRHTAQTAICKKFRVITATDLIADGSNVVGNTSGTERWFRNKCVLLPNSAMLFTAIAQQ
ncbi:MAG: isochorismatase family protein [Patescibacteria group bacterium]